MAQTLEFVVTGEEKMHCAGCEQRVSNALGRLPGVQSIQARWAPSRSGRSWSNWVIRQTLLDICRVT